MSEERIGEKVATCLYAVLAKNRPMATARWTSDLELARDIVRNMREPHDLWEAKVIASG